MLSPALPSSQVGIVDWGDCPPPVPPSQVLWVDKTKTSRLLSQPQSAADAGPATPPVATRSAPSASQAGRKDAAAPPPSPLHTPRSDSPAGSLQLQPLANVVQPSDAAARREASARAKLLESLASERDTLRRFLAESPPPPPRPPQTRAAEASPLDLLRDLVDVASDLQRIRERALLTDSTCL
eukprot:TRINITY_DN40857_c0_g1_i1.p1 TRINITY_DN40857_c0_g1~~TRINITY_DN40857_c0_g1_i1.p1  ORF type:complete len:203 (+),score=60.48 TRINITY_DN40857_c0_g1_i1:61-609(+)